MKFGKIAVSLLLCMCMLAGTITVALAAPELDSDEVFDTVLSEFEKIAAIPRPSGNTDAISNYLYQ